MGLIYYLTHKLDQALDANSQKITNLADGTDPGDAVNKGQLDAGGGGGGSDVATQTHAASSKTTPVDADEIPLVDSAASFALKKLTWSNLKATAKTYFDTLYPSGSGTSTGTNTGDQTTVSGNAGTATALQTSRNIDGQAFNGTADITVIAPGTHAATSKATPVDADELSLVDSAASNVLKKLTWANAKATLKTYFDGLYTALGASAPPNGTAGGDLGGTYPNPTVAALHETAGPTKLTVGSVPDGDYLVRSGSTIIGGSPTPGGPPTGAAGGDLTGTYPNPTIGAGKVVLADLGAAVTPGLTQLVYRYTVTGSDKASIDTGVDTPDAGSNDWTNGDLLEVYLYMRTDETAILSAVNLTLNNDGGAVYDRVVIQVSNTTVTGAKTLGGTAFALNAPGASAAASVFSPYKITFPAYTRTVGNKSGTLEGGVPDNSTSILLQNQTYDYRPASPAALTRLAIAPGTAGKKLKVGTQILIYKRLAS